MAGPIWARWVFALLFAGVGVCCVARLLAARRVPGATAGGDDPSMKVAELLMAVGMTAMFLPVATPIPPRWWAAVFAADTAWLGFRILRPPRDAGAFTVGRGGLLRGRSHVVTHVLAGLTMACMFAALPADGLSGSGLSHIGHLSASSAVFAVVGWLAAAYFLGHAVWCGIRVAVSAPEHSPGALGGAAPRGVVTLVGAQMSRPLGLIMDIGMSYMLMTML
jgi:hypothetical protein